MSFYLEFCGSRSREDPNNRDLIGELLEGLNQRDVVDNLERHDEVIAKLVADGHDVQGMPYLIPNLLLNCSYPDFKATLERQHKLYKKRLTYKSQYKKMINEKVLTKTISSEDLCKAILSFL